MNPKSLCCLLVASGRIYMKTDVSVAVNLYEAGLSPLLLLQ